MTGVGVTDSVAVHGLVGVADAGAFLARLVRLDPDAPVRLRRAVGGPAPGLADVGAARTALWGRLPWGVLVTREVAGAGPADATVPAAGLLASLAAGDAGLPPRCDPRWQWSLPTGPGRVVEEVSGAQLHRLAVAAAGTLRAAAAGGVAGRAVGQRAVRDALLDHVALTITQLDGEPLPVPQRLIQAAFRMGFLGPVGASGPATRVCVVGPWVGLSAPYGVAWLRLVSTLTIKPIVGHPIG